MLVYFRYARMEMVWHSVVAGYTGVIRMRTPCSNSMAPQEHKQTNQHGTTKQKIKVLQTHNKFYIIKYDENFIDDATRLPIGALTAPSIRARFPVFISYSFHCVSDRNSGRYLRVDNYNRLITKFRFELQIRPGEGASERRYLDGLLLINLWGVITG